MLQLDLLLIILKANLKLEDLKRIVCEKNEVQLKLNEISGRVEQVNLASTCRSTVVDAFYQLLKEKECLNNSMETLSKLNESLQAGIMERSDEVSLN